MSKPTLGSGERRNAAAGEEIPSVRGGPPDLRPVTLSAAAASWHLIRRCPPDKCQFKASAENENPSKLGGKQLRHFGGWGGGDQRVARAAKPRGLSTSWPLEHEEICTTHQSLRPGRPCTRVPVSPHQAKRREKLRRRSVQAARRRASVSGVNSSVSGVDSSGFRTATPS